MVLPCGTVVYLCGVGDFFNLKIPFKKVVYSQLLCAAICPDVVFKVVFQGFFLCPEFRQVFCVNGFLLPGLGVGIAVLVLEYK